MTESAIETAGKPNNGAVFGEKPTTELMPGEPKKIRHRAKPKFSFPLRVKAVALDLDGTMIDSAGDLVTATNKMRAAFGFAPLEAGVIRNFIGGGIAHLVSASLQDAVGEVGPSAIKVAVANFERQYAHCFGDTSAPFPGVVDGLNAFREQGFRLACITNKASKFTEPLLVKTGLRDYFEIVVSGDSLTEKKPHPLPLTHVASHIGCDAAAVLLIGDSLHDAACARAAGSPVFIVPYGYNHGQELRGLDCDAFIDDVPAALKLVKLAA